MLADSTALLVMLTRPAGCGTEPAPTGHCPVVGSTATGHGPDALASGANNELNRSPEDAVESLDTMVLLLMSTFNASSSDTPPPSQPATLLAMMLLVIWIAFQGEANWKAREPSAGCPGHEVALVPLGKLSTSVPLACCNRSPPPLPLSAELPMIRLALMTRPGPVPSLGEIEPGAEKQSLSLTEPQAGSGSGAPMISNPPPLVVMVGLVVWLKRMVL